MLLLPSMHTRIKILWNGFGKVNDCKRFSISNSNNWEKVCWAFIFWYPPIVRDKVSQFKGRGKVLPRNKGGSSGNRLQAVNIWRNIWKKYGNDKNSILFDLWHNMSLKIRNWIQETSVHIYKLQNWNCPST